GNAGHPHHASLWMGHPRSPDLSNDGGRSVGARCPPRADTAPRRSPARAAPGAPVGASLKKGPSPLALAPCQEPNRSVCPHYVFPLFGGRGGPPPPPTRLPIFPRLPGPAYHAKRRGGAGRTDPARLDEYKIVIDTDGFRPNVGLI